MKRAAAIASAVLFVLATGIYALLATETGLAWLARGAEQVFGGLKIGAVSGSVSGGFSLRDLNYRNATSSVGAREIRIEWQPGELLDGVLHFGAIRVEDVRIEQTGEEAEPSKTPRWPDLRLPLDVAVDDLQVRDAIWRSSEAAEPARLERIDARLKIREGRLIVERLALKTPDIAATLAGNIAPRDRRPIDLGTSWRLNLPNRPPFSGTGTVTGDLGHLTIVQQIEAPTAMSVTVEVSIGKEAVAWSAEADLPAFPLNRIEPGWKDWPLSVHLQGSGAGREAKVSGNFAMTLPDLGEARGNLALIYREPGELAIETLNLALPESGTEIAVSGQLRNIRKTPEIALEARWKNLLWPPQAKSEWRSPEGRLTIAGTRSDIRVELEGRVGEQRVRAAGGIGFPTDAVVFRDFRANSATTAFALDGVWGPRPDLRWTLKSDDLGIWLPGAKGRMSSRGKLEGTRSAPAVEAELDAAGLRFQDYGARELSLILKAGAEPESPLVFNLRAKEARFDGYTVAIDLSGRGSLQRHGLSGRIDSPPYALAFEAAGGWRERTWRGVLNRFDLKEPRSGAWTLSAPAGLKFARAGAELGDICLTRQGARWCFEGSTAESGEWRVSTRLSGFPLAVLRNLLPKPVPISGVLNGSAAFRGKEELIDQGILEIDAEGVAFEVAVDESKRVRIKPETAAVKADLSSRTLSVRLDLRQTGLMSVRGALESQGPFRLSDLQDRPVSGRVTADLETLAVLEPWLEQIEGLNGSFRAEVGIGGTAKVPSVDLQASVPDAGFRVPRLGIGVEHATLRANSSEQGRIHLEGRAMSGGGFIGLNGLWRLDAAAGWPLALNLEGKRFLGVDTPEAKVFLSPDLRITVERKRVDVRGRVEVPEASIDVPEKAAAVTPSDDVVLIDGQTGDKESEFRIYSDVEIGLGEKIRVKAAGFQGRLDGKVRIVQEPNEEARGTGQILIHDGMYSFHGVELTIDQGRLIFTNTPVDNPGLDITVTRKVDEILAGLRVLGFLKKPNATLYSRPPLPETDILAYLIAGKPLDFASHEEGNRLRDAAVSLGGAAGGLIAKEIGSRFGLGGLLDEIGVSAPNGAESTALFLGKYLTPRLYLQYGLGLFQSNNSFRLRYKLNKHWRIQSETGEQSGADILFEWEK
ncbi:translocation/assembly module TamB domain-containing protein [Methylocaldum sp. MU1018]